jgi:hypothetical protein
MVAEAVEQAQRKKIGRPKGARSAPPGLRAARWAMRHLDDEGAVAPSPLAGRLLALGRERPDRLAVVADELEAQARARGDSPAQGAAPAGAGGVSLAAEAPAGAAPSRRIKTITLSKWHLGQWLLRQDDPPWLHQLPDRFAVESCTVHPKTRQMTLTIRSKTFDPVPAGEPIPRIALG